VRRASLGAGSGRGGHVDAERPSVRRLAGTTPGPASAHADEARPSGALPTLCELVFASLPILYFRTFLYELAAAVLELCTLGELRLPPPGRSAARGHRVAHRRRLRSRRSPARGRPVAGWPEGRVLLLWPELDGALEAAVPATRAASRRRRRPSRVGTDAQPSRVAERERRAPASFGSARGHLRGTSSGAAGHPHRDAIRRPRPAPPVPQIRASRRGEPQARPQRRPARVRRGSRRASPTRLEPAPGAGRPRPRSRRGAPGPR
jgi:hypothetical protein